MNLDSEYVRIRPGETAEAPAIAEPIRSALLEYEHLYTRQAFGATILSRGLGTDGDSC